MTSRNSGKERGVVLVKLPIFILFFVQNQECIYHSLL